MCPTSKNTHALRQSLAIFYSNLPDLVLNLFWTFLTGVRHYVVPKNIVLFKIINTMNKLYIKTILKKNIDIIFLQLWFNVIGWCIFTVYF